MKANKSFLALVAIILSSVLQAEENSQQNLPLGDFGYQIWPIAPITCDEQQTTHSATITALQSQLEQLQSDLAAANGQISTITTKNKNLSSQRKNLQQHISELQTLKSASDTELEKANNLAQSTTEENDLLKTNRDQLEGELTQAHQQQEASNQQVVELKTAIESFTQEENVAAVKYQELQSQLDMATQQIENSAAQGNKLKILLEQRNNELAQAQQQLQDSNQKTLGLQSTFASLDQEKNTLLQTHQDLQNQLATHEEQRQNTAAQLNEAHALLEQRDSELTQIQQREHARNQQIQELTQTLESSNQEKINLSQENKQLQARLDQHEATVAELTNRETASEQDRSQLNNTLSALTEEKEGLMNTHQQLQTKVGQLEKQINILTRQRDENLSQLEQSNLNLAAERKNLQTINAEQQLLTSSLQATQQEKEKLSINNNLFKEQLAVLSVDIKALEVKEFEQSNSLNEEQQRTKEAISSLEACETRFHEAQTENQKLTQLSEELSGNAHDLEAQLAHFTADTDNDGIMDTNDRCPTTKADAKVDMTGCSLFMALKGVTFSYDSDELTPESRANLISAATMLRENPDIKVEVAGHTDNQGHPAYNLDISERRALAVMNYLITKDVPAANLSAHGYGQEQPIADNDSLEGRVANRRVELRYIE